MLVPMTIEHAIYVSKNMKERSLNGVAPLMFEFDPVEFAVGRYITDGIKMTALADDGTPVGIGGIHLNRPMVWTAWVVGTDRWGECGREIIFAARRMVRRLLDGSDSCKRIQAMVATDDELARRYVELVGFKHESDMPLSRKDGGSMSMYVFLQRKDT